MTGLPQSSGRWSGRVMPGSHRPTEGAGAQPINAPEGMTASAIPLSPPERTRPRGPARSSRAQTERLARDLSDRDQAVMATLHSHRFLTTTQLQRFHFADHATPDAAARICRRVLHRLHQLRVIEHLDRRVGGVRAGSASYVWRVGPVGDQLLRLAADGQPRGRRKEPSLHHLQHTLAVADTHLTLRDLAATGQIELLKVETEPACWRTYLGFGGGRETLKPDIYAVTGNADFEDHWLLEVDRATESMPTLLRKCAQYEAYRRTSSAEYDGGVFPLIVWIVPDQARADTLIAAIAGSRQLDASLYRVCVPGSFSAVITGAGA